MIGAVFETKKEIAGNTSYNKTQLEDAMRKLASFLMVFGLCAMPAFAAAETYKDVPVVSVYCFLNSEKYAADPDSHPRDCALKCERSGYGIKTKDQQFLKFDAEGNTKVVEALKASDKKDHLRVDVSGDVQGDTLKVTSIKLL
jgi:hypothetical protein